MKSIRRSLQTPGLAFKSFVDSSIRRVSPNRCFFPNKQYPWIQELEASYELIREEMLAVLQSNKKIPEFKDLSRAQEMITEGTWQTYLLFGYGEEIYSNSKCCPQTVRLLKKIPGMKTAMFSIFAPQTRLDPHKGPYGGVLRYHLALLVPTEKHKCGIRVGNEKKFWEEGKSLVFDDTHEHEAWNLTDQHRVVLFVDFVRELPFPVSVLNSIMIWLIRRSHFVREVLENQRRQDEARQES